MKIDRSGIPFIVAALLPAAGLSLAKRPGWAAPFVGLAGLFLFFFRDPERVVPADPGAVVAPADGRVLVAARPEAAGAPPPGEWNQLSIFLSPLDVHVNRAPVSGRVVRVDYQPGGFVPAYRPEAAISNERNEIWIDHRGQPVVCRQVAGILARRLVCRVQPGDTLRAGERFGIMKFGSRVDLFLPPSARLQVKIGDRVRAGETVVATFEERP